MYMATWLEKLNTMMAFRLTVLTPAKNSWRWYEEGTAHAYLQDKQDLCVLTWDQSCQR